MTVLPPRYGNQGIDVPPIGRTTAPLVEATDARTRTRSALADIFPEFATVTGGFSVLPIELGAVAAPNCAWYGLIDAPVGKLFGEEVGLFSAYVDLLSPDVDGAGGASNPVAWGNTKGQGAAIVIGRDLPIRVGEWSVRPHRVPGLDSSTRVVRSSSRYLMIEGLPPGKFTATAPVPRSQPRTLAPTAARFNVDDRLQAAFVLGADYANNASGNLYGRVMVELHVVRTQATQLYLS